MIALLIVLLVIVTGLAVAAVMGRFGGVIDGSMDDPVRTSAFEALPEGHLTSEEVSKLRFDQTARGYRMGQVDDVLDRLRSALDDRDAEIADLRSQLRNTADH
ncbi:DivIVA domain-containing protein [Yimella sp. cx-51]|uniref:DivIVA domain-containing protein n=1 Tax=Yimella sp. cx-51 TaxID=2770551 RepID=UPI001FCBC0EE|nr:DivIVA domain-containing protein [Yimella sp. cx-51]